MGKTIGKGEKNPLCQKLVQKGRDSNDYYIGINITTLNPIHQRINIIT